MNFYTRKQRWKFLLFLFAVGIGISSLWYTNNLVEKLSVEERKKVELWAEATRRLADITITEQDYGFLFEVILNNRTVPVILADQDEVILSHKNLDTTRVANPGYLERHLKNMKESQPPIEIDLGDDKKNFIYYENSILLRKLTWYPFIQLAIIVLFIMVSYFAFSFSRRMEQNKVWVGLTKETAHQLGTPTSSLMAWVELLKLRGIEDDVVSELEKDVKRLEKITERFSKVGSKPRLKERDVTEIARRAMEYLQTRTSDKIEFHFHEPEQKFIADVSPSLFEWVLENIMKNAVDAVAGSGRIDIRFQENTKFLYIDINDNGKGIPKSNRKDIFKPGFTTKARGWGLGLSLSKRIIEEYHSGKIYVLNSEIDKGTTIRVGVRKRKAC